MHMCSPKRASQDTDGFYGTGSYSDAMILPSHWQLALLFRRLDLFHHIECISARPLFFSIIGFSHEAMQIT